MIDLKFLSLIRAMINSILPFSYKLTAFDMIDTGYLYQFSWSDEILDTLSIIQKIPCKYKPIWGIKFEDNKIIDLELYFYQYHPIIGKTLYEDIITPNVFLKHFPEYDRPFVNQYPMTMFSVDLINKSKHLNYYYATKVTPTNDEGFNTTQESLQNVYYRYYSNNILSHQRYIESDFLTYYKTEKTFFVADKQFKNMIGCYYDGINETQYNLFINKYKLKAPALYEFQRCSVHVDYICNTKTPKRFGIYGILV